MDFIEGDIKFKPETTTTTFDDVRGISECKEELADIVDMIRNRNKYTKLGAKLPRGIVLTGEPGTGKTLLARAIAGESGVNFFSSSASDFEEVFVGVGAKRVRSLFEAAKMSTPSIIFIDELDALGTSRKTKAGMIESQRGTLNQLLVEMDGFKESENIIVIGATNVGEDLDHALMRPGRFDKEISVPIPHLSDREEIIKFYISKVNYDPKIDIKKLARTTTGFTGADISNLVNTAILIAVNDNRSGCNENDFEKARDRIQMGIASPSIFRSEKQKFKVALREIAKSLTILWTNGSYQLYKTSIMRRGNKDGKTISSPLNDVVGLTKEQALAHIDIKLSSKVCEDIFFTKNKTTEVPGNDLIEATSGLKNLLMQGLFEDRVGVLFFRQFEQLGVYQKELIDTETEKLLKESYERVKNLLSKQKNLIEFLAHKLVEKETLNREQLLSLINEYNEN